MFDKFKAEKVEHVDEDTKTDVVPAPAPPPQDVWGDLDGEGPNYRGLGWVRSAVVMVKIQIGLGVLAIVSLEGRAGLLTYSLPTSLPLVLRRA